MAAQSVAAVAARSLQVAGAPPQPEAPPQLEAPQPEAPQPEVPLPPPPQVPPPEGSPQPEAALLAMAPPQPEVRLWEVRLWEVRPWEVRPWEVSPQQAEPPDVPPPDVPPQQAPPQQAPSQIVHAPPPPSRIEPCVRMWTEHVVPRRGGSQISCLRTRAPACRVALLTRACGCACPEREPSCLVYLKAEVGRKNNLNMEVGVEETPE